MADPQRFTAKIISPERSNRRDSRAQQDLTTDRTFEMEIDSSNDKGRTKLYDVTDQQNKVYLGFWEVDDNGNKKFTLTQDAKNKNYSIDYLKEIQSADSTVSKTLFNQRNTVLAEITGNTGQKFNGVQGATTTESLAQDNVTTLEDLEISQAMGGVADKNINIKWPQELERLYYPVTLENNEWEQDYIHFTLIDYRPRVFKAGTLALTKRYEEIKDRDSKPITRDKLIRSRIRLPIQSGISDGNIVTWNSDPLNAVQQASQFTSLTLAATGPESMPNLIKAAIGLVENAETNAAIRTGLQAFLARTAASGQNNLMSRAFGNILNPNLELLFQNPELRSFQLRFDLTPRDADEAKMVRKIIRAFKQSMAPRQGAADLFLKTPMVYDLEYINGKPPNKGHKSLNKFKTCALRSFNVNYTPANQYMTYNDDANTMTAYSLDMQFAELEPIYYDDYGSIPADEIGY